MDTKRVTIKIPVAAKEKLDAIATKQRRNLVNTLEYALDVYLALHDDNGNTKYSLDSIVDQRALSNVFEVHADESANLPNSDNVNGYSNTIETNISEPAEVQQTQEYTPLF